MSGSVGLVSATESVVALIVLPKIGIEGTLAMGGSVSIGKTARVVRDISVTSISNVVIDNWLRVDAAERILRALLYGDKRACK